MTFWKEYHSPRTVAEALSILVGYDGRAKIVAGGTDLILDLQFGNHEPVEALVDVTAIPDLREISEEDGWIVLGAAVTHAQIERSTLLAAKATALVESCSVVGGPQVRNVATIGGNVAHALPAADGTIGLLALDAEVRVCSWQDDSLTCTWQPLLSIFAGPGRTILASHQLIAAFRLAPAATRQVSAFERIMRPQGVALPILGVAANVIFDASLTKVTKALIAVGPAGPIPFRATNAEMVLTASRRFDEEAVSAAVAAAQEQAQLRTSKHRATKEYRHEMLAVLLRRVLATCAERARTEAGV